ncbi:hypothetical protein [Shewanella sp. Koi 1]
MLRQWSKSVGLPQALAVGTRRHALDPRVTGISYVRLRQIELLWLKLTDQ